MDSEPVRTNLKVDRKKADARIVQLIEEGEAIILSSNDRSKTFDELSNAAKEWKAYTVEFLKRTFTTDEVADGFQYECALPTPHTLDGRFQWLTNVMRGRINALKSIHRRLELFELDGPNLGANHPGNDGMGDARRVFVVHGHEETTKHAVARFLRDLDLQPIILQEQPDQGRTIIEKFEAHADVHFAVVLLTRDDEGCVYSSGKHRPRARQNVILELGYFLGKLGRSRVCALKASGVEEPSDLHGVLYVPLDTRGAWRMALARELKAAGLDVDLNRAI
jgi:hypothetical protein